MTEGKRRIDRITAEDYIAGLSDRPIAEIRSMRSECTEEEALVSYERRVLHGRLSLLRFELDRRAGKEQGSLVDNLARILADEQRGPSRGSIPLNDPDLEQFGEPRRHASRLISDDTLARLPDLSDDEVKAYIDELTEAEREVSEMRTKVLAALDALNEELGRRYKTGEADPSDVLT